MKPKGVFIFIDDDEPEHIMFRSAIKNLGYSNEVVSAKDGEDGYQKIKDNKDNIFLIICDINMPRINGIELKRMVESTPEIKLKAIPFIFHSTMDNPVIVKEAFALGIQGFVKKSDNLADSVQNLDIIIKFWSTTVHPNSVEN